MVLTFEDAWSLDWEVLRDWDYVQDLHSSSNPRANPLCESLCPPCGFQGEFPTPAHCAHCSWFKSPDLPKFAKICQADMWPQVLGSHTLYRFLTLGLFEEFPASYMDCVREFTCSLTCIRPIPQVFCMILSHVLLHVSHRTSCQIFCLLDTKAIVLRRHTWTKAGFSILQIVQIVN